MNSHPSIRRVSIVGTVAALLCSVSAAQYQYIAPRIDSQGRLHDGYYRSTPNANRYDNLNSESMGTNPMTGRKARDRDEFSNPPAYNRTSPLATPDYGAAPATRSKRSTCLRDILTGHCL